MNWDDLQHFLAVWRTKTFVAAGRELGVNPTTVARPLAALEETLGTPLFQRTNDGLIPLPPAHAIHSAAEAVERHATIVATLAKAETDVPEGSVRVATTQEIANEFITPGLADLHQRHPKITLEFLMGSAYAALSRGEVDIAIRFSKVDEKAPVPSHAENSFDCSQHGTLLRSSLRRPILSRSSSSPIRADGL